jgi:hypothetical protein
MKRYFNWVSRNQRAFEVRSGVDGPVHVFASEVAAMRFAINQARLLWVDEGIPTGVRWRDADGDWQTAKVFGTESTDHETP